MNTRVPEGIRRFGRVRAVHRRRCVAVAAILLAPACCPGWYPYSGKYNQWQEGRPFEISGLHSSIPSDKLLDRAKRFQAAGLSNYCGAKPEHGIPMYHAASQLGLAWSCWARGGTGVVSQAMAIPGTSWILAGDEPSSVEDVAEIADMADWIRQSYPDTPTFANLSIAKIDHDYLIAEVQPDIFSFDHYPLQRNGVTQDYYLYNVDWGRQTAVEHQLPYWMYLQSFGRDTEPASYAYRIPDEADMRFLFFSFLAHGGTGIMLFNYYGYEEAMILNMAAANPPGSDPPHIYEYTRPSRAWYAVRDLAQEVQHLGRALVHLRTKDEVMYTGNGMLWNQPPPTYSQHNPDPPIANELFAPHPPLQSVRVVLANSNGVTGVLDDGQAGINVPFDTDLHSVEWGSAADVCCGTWTVSGGTATTGSDGVDSPRLIYNSTLKNQPGITTPMNTSDGWVATTEFSYTGTIYVVTGLEGAADVGGNYELRLYGNELSGGNQFRINLRDYTDLVAPFDLAPGMPHEYAVHYRGVNSGNLVDCYIDGQRVVDGFDLDDHPTKSGAWHMTACQIGGGGPYEGAFAVDSFTAAPAPPGAVGGDPDNMGVQIGFFDDQAGEEYFMIVNLMHGLNMSKREGLRTIELGFEGGIGAVERLNRWTGQVETLHTVPGSGNTSSLTFPLEGGTGDLFKWSNGNPWSLQ